MGKDHEKPIPYDPRFNGPSDKRSCTDVLFLILFILFLGVWGWVGIHGTKNGSIEKLLAPVDSIGKPCGVDSELRDKKYLVFFDISKCLSPGMAITGCHTKKVCVSKCPGSTILFSQMTETTFPKWSSSMVCTYDIKITDMNFTAAQEYIRTGKCAKYVINSKPVLGRCIVNVKEALDIIKIPQSEGNKTQVLTEITEKIKYQQVSAQIVQDLVQSRWYMVGALLAVVLVCFIYILLLRWVVAPVVWGSIFGLLAVLVLSIYLCYEKYVYYKDNVKGETESVFNKHQMWLALVIILAITLAILLIIFIFLRSRLTIAIAMIKEGSKAVCANKSAVLFPIFPWILQCGVIAYGVVVLVLLISIGESTFSVANLNSDNDCICPDYKEGYPCNPLTFSTSCHKEGGDACEKAICNLTGIDNPTSVVYLHLINMLGFFWTMFFISGVSDMMLANTFATWYWTFHKKDLPFFTLTSGIITTLRYHLGTVAFGSLIIAIIRIIRYILQYADRKTKKFDNSFTRCIKCFCKCFCWCLENFLKFINKNAYIMCAIHGKNFCSSARDAFSLLMRNIVRVVVLDKVTDFIFLLSKILISVGVGIAVYFILQSNVVYEVTKEERLNYNYIPAIILSVATYLICTIFFNVYAMAVDTLFLCFLEDCERNDGSAEKPYFMSKNLMKILGKKNKRE